MAPSTIFQLTKTGAKTFQLLAKITRQTPCYYLKLGTDLKQIPNVIIDFLERQ